MVTKQFYDYGWNAYINGEVYDSQASIDWRDGYKDAKDAAFQGREIEVFVE